MDQEEFRESRFILASTLRNFPSIDEAIHYHSSNVNVVKLGKLAITYYILLSERSGQLRIDIDKPHNLDIGWMTPFMPVVVGGTIKEESAKLFRNINIIDFNYDRVIKHYLYYSLRLRYGLDEEEAGQAISGLKIIKPYGSLGPLPWEGAAGGVPYGEANFGLASEGSRISTYTEGIGAPGLKESIFGALTASRLVVILGFGFHRQNLEILTSDPKPAFRRKVIATAKTIKEANFPTMKKTLSSKFYTRTENVSMFETSCKELIVEYKPMISAFL